MRANICWIIWAGLLLTLNADDGCLIETRYQCKSGDSSSHDINVFVHVDDGRGRTTVPQKNESSTHPEPKVDSWIYMYLAAGIVPFIIIIISVLMCRCQGKSKNETQTEVQYIAIPAEKPIAHASLQPSPRII
ncbi:hypothetical protein CesoFtcFv8_027579 [Champsocephalus esox]|uniref:Uncharacterized protein n=1 Tax=Champsocephalus esox TaxID=159716 RepID=A0AAN7YC77_9TELE|nr:hypothetical protein CesoFtcFv8_027579 [Champsocephalus esox]